MFHTVRSGDTLGRIAARHGTDVKTILLANPQITNPSIIHVGDRITIPTALGRPVGTGGSRPSVGNEQSGPAGFDDYITDLYGYFTDLYGYFTNVLASAPSWWSTPSTGSRSDPPWLVVAKQQSGVKEATGSASNPRIVDFVESTNRPQSDDWDDDDVPWCSAFVNWCMVQAGQPRTNSMMAISWKKLWREGTDVGRPAYGAIAVIQWHQDKATCQKWNCNRVSWWDNPPRWLSNAGLEGCTKGHVGFVVGKQGGRVVFLGGNQGDQVKLSDYPESAIIGYMFPSDYEVPEDAYDLPQYTEAQVDSGSFAATR